MTFDFSVSPLEDEAILRWSCLDAERDACAVVSERMELVYLNAAARELVRQGEWFGKRCFEALAVVDETCAFGCPKIRAVAESSEVVYCEETMCLEPDGRTVFGMGLIPIGPARADHGRAILLLRTKAKDGCVGQRAFQGQLLSDARRLARRVL